MTDMRTGRHTDTFIAQLLTPTGGHVKQVCVDPRTSDSNVKRWPLLLSGAGRYRPIDGCASFTGFRSTGQTDGRTNRRTDISPTHRRFLLEAASVKKLHTCPFTFACLHPTLHLGVTQSNGPFTHTLLGALLRCPGKKSFLCLD